MAIPDSAKELSCVDKGADAHNVGYKRASIRSATVYQLKSGKYALEIRAAYRMDEDQQMEWAHDMKRQYRHAEIDDLMAIALDEERDDDIRAAIREAIYTAQDVIDAQTIEATT
jgi:hypothetical protein